MNNQLIVWHRSLRVITGKHSCRNSAFLQGIAVDQSGAVLIISLIMLLLLTIIGTSSIQTTSLEEKMAGNLRDRNLAFQAAESGLRAGEAFLTQATLPSFTSAGTGGLYNETGITPLQNDDWSTFNTITYSTATLINTVSPPLYVIQRLKNIGSSSLDAANYNESELYQITARGVGSSSNAVVVLQAMYKR
ncbi:MAG: PilX N-terminal domain-containing pilus assembly protein [Methylococcaceae bacterium]